MVEKISLPGCAEAYGEGIAPRSRTIGLAARGAIAAVLSDKGGYILVEVETDESVAPVANTVTRRMALINICRSTVRILSLFCG